MIARVATFSTMTSESRAIGFRNLVDRFLPALRVQPGFVTGYWLEAPDGSWLSVTVWESEQNLMRGSAQANAVPLLPGHEPGQIPAPDHVETYSVFAAAPG
jgi:hypothetical protein